MRIILTTAAVLGLTACGAKQDQAPAKNEQPVEEIKLADETVEAPAEKPEMILVRVKEDANGEIVDGAEAVSMAAVDSAIDLSESNIEDAFASAQSVEAGVNGDNLDGDASEAQYRWGYGYGYGRGFARGYYRGWGHRGFRYGYRPYFYNRGYAWGYGYRNFYRRGGYRFYCYY